MDQKKIGLFLKTLRKEKSLTQEELACQVGVSRRSVSRWETGNNMPDLDILLELADFYEVDIRELLDGERRRDHMNKETEETVLKVADYMNEETIKNMRRIHVWFILALILDVFYLISLFIEPSDPSPIFEFVQGFCVGVSIAMIFIGVLITNNKENKLMNFKKRILMKLKSQ
ncbi:Transcriptional regulator, contains XRE-family HTH domain [Kandleria vitulina]|jgi:transcriptional regulator with XRE-family HTH domain|uniref:Transcriptional regulator, xre family n=2 Tax=Kandleria vitulina TaxID=1630 RepID=A0A0R2HAR7_9FIRM|nr:helix-turn-helix transcriptional regulator [Kandleria vitulina]KRN50017.1 transcriptional regulator, xre family [Kandleria vitulina DSM 20405]SDW49814.1 Transcriptional regulator, contains XRE-family HTH domain [Kandleria vitulina]